MTIHVTTGRGLLEGVARGGKGLCGGEGGCGGLGCGRGWGAWGGAAGVRGGEGEEWCACAVTVSVITNDGRNIVGVLKGFDQATNIILDESHERVYSTKHGVEQLVLGLYIIRGDNIAVVGELDEDLDSSLDFDALRAQPLQPVSSLVTAPRRLSLPSHALLPTLPFDVPSRAPLLSLMRAASGTLHVPLPLDKLMCHVAGTEMARDALQDRGWDVIGAYMSPVNDQYGKQGLAPAKERVAMCQLACADSPFIMVDPWESSQPCYQRTLCVLRRLHHTLNAPTAPTPSSAAQAQSPAAKAQSSATQPPSSAAQPPSFVAQPPSSATQAPSPATHPTRPMPSPPSLGSQSFTSPLPPHPPSHQAAPHPPSPTPSHPHPPSPTPSHPHPPSPTPSHPHPPSPTPSHPHPPSPTPPYPHPPSPTPSHPHPALHTHMWALDGAMAESPALLPTAAAGACTQGGRAEEGQGGGEGGRGGVQGREGGGNREEGEDDGWQGVRGVGGLRSEEGERRAMGVVARAVTGERRESGGGVGGQGVEAAEGQQGAEGRVQVMLVCGADLLESFTQPGVWVPSHVEEVVGAHGVVCIARHGADAHRLVLLSHLLHRHRHNILIVDQPIENNVSSSHIRRLLQRGLSAKYLVPDAVLGHIRAAHLYERAD
ncbi:unnamed protein product [Closterium sp. NIES-64]|nr:unnamed protein product [Closterium sp. NIES-64]